MYDCVPLFVPSNLGETELSIRIAPEFDESARSLSGIKEYHKGFNETYRFDGFSCFIQAETVRKAQQTVNRFSKQLEEHTSHPVQSDRLYFLPLFVNVCYRLTVAPKIHHERPVIRIEHCPDNLLKTWTCKIYTSNLVQLQEALFSHEQNLLKKRLQVLNQRRAKTWESELT